MKFLRLHSRQVGFTLMELLIVVALIMILSAIGVGGYIASVAKSRDTQRKGDLNQYAKAVEAFYTDVGRYPTSEAGEPKCYEVTLGIATDVNCLSSGTGGKKLSFKQDGQTTNYLVLPKDPDSGQSYYYESDGSSFALYTAIQNEDDRDLIKTGGVIMTYTDNGVTCGSLPCNYKINETGLVK